MRTQSNKILNFAAAMAVLLLAAAGTSRADNIFVANYGNNTIEKFNSSGVGTVFASASLSQPVDIAFDSAGNVYVSNFGGDSSNIEKFSSSGADLGVFASGLNGPAGLAFDKTGNLYVVSAFGNYIEKFNSGGMGSVFTSGLNGPFGLAFDSKGNLYVGNDGNGTIEKFNSSGVGTVFASGLYGPIGLAFDSKDNLYVANYGGGPGYIEKFDPAGDGTVVADYFSGGMMSLAGLAIDSSDNLYAGLLDRGAIEEFNSYGAGNVFASGLDQPYGLAIEATPEPSAWVLLAGGLIVAFWHGGIFQRRNDAG